MFEFLYHLTDMQLFALLSGIFGTFSVVAIITVRMTIPLKLRYHDNPVIGNVRSLNGKKVTESERLVVRDVLSAIIQNSKLPAT